MQNPSPQFTEKLEQELRLAYRAQYQQAGARNPLAGFLKIFVTAFSGVLVLSILVLNYAGVFNADNAVPQSTDSFGMEDNLSALNDSSQEAQAAQDFDNDELAQIDNNVQTVANGNF
jgi:hypothetical protein